MAGRRPRMVLVHAHPDDESITCGGVMALAVAAGAEVTLVTCTLGEQGEVIPPELAHLEGTAALADHRAGELAAACAALGVADHRLLGGRGRWRDSGMVATGDGIRAAAPADLAAGAFAGPDGAAQQVAQLGAVLDELAPDVVVSYDAVGGYGHPDHVRAHEITAAAVAGADPAGTRIALHACASSRADVAAGLDALRARGPLALPVPPVDDLPTVPDEAITIRVPLGRARARKVAALRAHATQIRVLDEGADPPAYGLSHGLAQPVPATECFVQLRGPASGPTSLFPPGLFPPGPDDPDRGRP